MPTEGGVVYSITLLDKLTKVKRVHRTILKPVPDVSPLIHLPCTGLESVRFDNTRIEK